MPKFTMIAEHTDIYGKVTPHKITHEFNVDSLDDVLENFDLFLRGAGFMPPPGFLNYNVDEYSDHGGGSTLADYENHSEYYFDTQRNK